MSENVSIRHVQVDMPEWIEWSCGTCGEPSQVLYDPSAGYRQEFIEDCSVCCRPNVISFDVDPAEGTLRIGVSPE